MIRSPAAQARMDAKFPDIHTDLSVLVGNLIRILNPRPTGSFSTQSYYGGGGGQWAKNVFGTLYFGSFLVII